MKLTPQEQRAVDASIYHGSREGIQHSFASLSGNFEGGSWLSKRNRYRVSCIKILGDEIKHNKKITHSNLSQYIAASGPLHCADGWSYLGRSLCAHLNGDTGASTHLAYYAELRAAMSLLAAEGVGIFNNRHFAVDRKARCIRTNKSIRTHVMAWAALQSWAGTQKSRETLSDLIHPFGLPLSTWLQAFGYTSQFKTVGEKWLKAWGLDIERLALDQESRNSYSYRPTRLNERSHPLPREALSLVTEFWNTFNPEPPSSFQILDSYFLRIGVEQGFKALTESSARQSPVAFERSVTKALVQFDFGKEKIDYLKQFLCRKVSPNDPAIIVHASRRSILSTATHHIEVMCRAALLLRVATGACQQLLQATGTNKSDLNFWWEPFGQEIGLWPGGHIPDSFGDLWEDVSAALEDLSDWEPTTTYSYHSLQSSVIGLFGALTRTERIALWGLFP